jgi:formylglycine-generating enzyme required for sulfatase activity
MGSPADDPFAYKDERPQQVVVFERPLWVAETPVTQGQYAALVGKNPACYKTSVDHPVESVTYYATQEWCAALNAHEGAPKRAAYRLPSEAEWEYFCRAGTTTRWWTGDTEESLPSAAWYGAGWDHGHTHAVAQLRANPWGLYDVHGNVGEWCRDRLRTYGRGEVRAPVGRGTNDDGYSVRGGAFGGAARFVRSANRGEGMPEWPSRSRGFRIVRPA